MSAVLSTCHTGLASLLIFFLVEEPRPGLQVCLVLEIESGSQGWGWRGAQVLRASCGWSWAGDCSKRVDRSNSQCRRGARRWSSTWKGSFSAEQWGSCSYSPAIRSPGSLPVLLGTLSPARLIAQAATCRGSSVAIQEFKARLSYIGCLKSPWAT